MAVDSTLVVSIGRATGLNEQLDQPTWNTFKESIAQELRSFANLCDGQVVFTGSGLGTWTEADGTVTEEDAFTVIVVGWNGSKRQYLQGEDDNNVQGLLEDTLARYAALYGQECIAATVGTTTLVQRNY